ncbi:MAG: SMC family ATPase [Gemmataceae bacterium]|nr:SMC family ATPase [Gemmataceae bacterium]
MIPQRVKLSGFLSYKDEQEVRFDGSQLWMLSGTNGSGKSSVFDAVTFALFGHHRGGSQSAAELINKESNTLAVEFDFTIEGTPYRIRRTVRRRPTTVASTQQVLKWIAQTPPASHPTPFPSPSPTGERGKPADPTPRPPPRNEEGEEDGGSVVRSPLSPRGRGLGGGVSSGGWEPVPDTQLKAKFDGWVKDRIGLDYETFTSSVLLLQGKSEKLLDSTPAGRAGVLARIVDLERYQKLHGKADDRRREYKARLDGLSNQLAGLRDVTDDELAAAADRIAVAEDARAAAQGEIDRLTAVEIQARNWADKQKTLTAARDKLTHAQALLGHAVAIEKDFARLKELREVLPAVGVIATERGRVSESERKSDKLAKERDGKADTRRQTEAALDQARKKLAALKKTLGESEAQQITLNARLRELSAVLEKVRQAEDAGAEVKRHEDELKRLPPDPDAAVAKLQDEQHRLAALAQVVPLLVRLHTDRAELRQTLPKEAAARTAEAKLKADGLKAKADAEKLTADLTTARERRGKADEAAAEARALAQQARLLADEFKTLTGAKSCRACGQALTPEHFAAEKGKRDRDAAAADKKAADTAAASADARKLEDDLTARESAARDRLLKLREEYKEKSGEVKQAVADLDRLAKSCRESYIGLPDEYKRKVAPGQPDDWAATVYPERTELSALHKDVATTDEVGRQLREAHDAANKARTVRAKLDAARDRLGKVRDGLPPGDPATLRQDHADAQSADVAVASQIKGTKAEVARTEADGDRHGRALAGLDAELAGLHEKLKGEENSRAQSRQTIDQMTRSLPAGWQKLAETAGMTERAKWQDEVESLVSKGTEEKFTNLKAARGGLESLRAEITTLEQEADAFPDEAKRSPEEVRSLVAAARKAHDERNRELLAAQREKGLLDGYRQQRAELTDKLKAADADHARHKLLAELLGRDRLQRHLVRTAERQIVSYANAVLDRLSGGQLFLKLVGTDDGTAADKALDLECSNRVTGGSPINVAFLSGSQRFRVAVALALGIGQYAGKQHRPIESVIIDEGFGCLDRAGRQVMIQELQNLRGHLHCILLVSHQEEFADAFPDGYRFELHDGQTRVSRFQR